MTNVCSGTKISRRESFRGGRLLENSETRHGRSDVGGKKIQEEKRGRKSCGRRSQTRIRLVRRITEDIRGVRNYGNVTRIAKKMFVDQRVC